MGIPTDDIGLSGTPVLLVNPNVPLSTPAVFKAWDGVDRGPLGDWREGRNDLEVPVIRHHPAIGRIRQSLLDAGAAFAAMSGSGSAVFGLFERADAARRTANDLARPGWLSLHTRTLNRRDYARRVAAGL